MKRMFNRRFFPLVLIPLAVIALSQSLILPASAFRFAVIGDTRPASDDSSEFPKIFSSMLANVDEMKAVFLINVGDLVAVKWRKDRDELKRNMEAAFDSYLALFKDIKTPVYNIPGNHDCFDRISREAYAAKISKDFYRSIWCGNCLFILLDTEEKVEANKASLAKKQEEWLKRELEAGAKARAIFVFMHRPIFTDGPHKNSSMNEATRDKLSSLFEKYGVTAVFAGHEHYFAAYNKESKGGIRYIITGGGGAHLYKVPKMDGTAGAFHEYVLVDVKKSGISYRVIRFDDDGTMSGAEEFE
jgi:UDP-2,3-diacylglucosamine pyrophosphatase LpxH